VTTYEDALELLRQRWEHVMEPDLTRIRRLLDALGEPQRSAPSVHVTGTNGKTSTARMVDALLRAHELRTGRITSPHLSTPRERISIDGEPIDEERFVAVWQDIAPLVELVDTTVGRVTYFEVMTAMAFATFADTPVDAQVVEVGLGGLWDATNVLDAGVAVVTPVSLDHTALLGDTVEAIATEKAGIIHAGALAVIAEPLDPLMERIEEVGATPLVLGRDFGIEGRRVAVGGQVLTLRGLGGATYDELLLPLHGRHQAQNASLALAAAGAFLGAVDGRPLELERVREGFAMADSPGRLEIIQRDPTVILDGAHNPAGMHALAEALAEEFALDRLVVVLAVLGDKDVGGLVAELPPATAVIATRSDSPRAMPAEELARLVPGAQVEPSLPLALARAFELAREVDGAVLVTGSLTAVGQARGLLLGA
jgi:dihydrofolate synthase/folylpolyglutamate synthase